MESSRVSVNLVSNEMHNARYYTLSLGSVLHGDGDAVTCCDIYECCNMAVSSHRWRVNWSCFITFNCVAWFDFIDWNGMVGCVALFTFSAAGAGDLRGI